MYKILIALGICVAGVFMIPAQATAQTQLQYSQLGSSAQTSRTAIPIRSIEVFANSAMLITPKGTDAKIYWMDGIARMGDEISKGLPKTQKEAEQYLAAKRPAIEQRYRPQIANAGQGITLGLKYGIEKIPAIVINQESVIYGLTDVNEALAHYQKAKQAQMQKSRVK